MTHAQIQLVQQSFEQLVPSGDEALEVFFGEIFYQHLRAAHPDFKLFFTADTAVQGQPFLRKLRLLLTHLEQTTANLEVSPDDAVGSALIWTLERTFAEDFNPELRTAWLEVYQLLARTIWNIVANESWLS